MSEGLSVDQAYAAMFAFLEQHQKLTNSDDIGDLLSSMSLAPDGRPSDPALEDAWKTAVKFAQRNEIDLSRRSSAGAAF